MKLMTHELDVNAIHPSRGVKYSPNLYKWLTNQKHLTWSSHVFRDQDGVRWIGMLDDGFMVGCRLIDVLCNGTKVHSSAYPLKDIGPLEEVTDFWMRYVEDGRCAIDPDHEMHFVGDDTRWRMDGDGRECLWCGKVRQRRERYTRTTEHERWVNVPIDERRDLSAERRELV